MSSKSQKPKQRSVESESSQRKKTAQNTSKKRKNVETESPGSSATRQQPKRLAREDSDLPSSASKFTKGDTAALNATFESASNENEVIPDVEVNNFPDEYVLPNIGRKVLAHTEFDVRQLEDISKPKVQTFLTKLNDVVVNSKQAVGTDETFTDTFVDDLLRIAKLNRFPLRIRNQPPTKLYIQDVARVISVPDFVIEKKNSENRNIVVDKQLKNVGYATDFGEQQIAVEILSCGSENIRSLGEAPRDQTIWAIRVISTYVTFYKAMITAMYWMELANGLPKEESVKVQRWPAENGLTTGFDLAEPEGRRSVLTALTKIRESLL